MKTYVKQDHKGYYVIFPDEIDTEYWAGHIGYTYDDFENNKWILLSDEQVMFHEENPYASIKEVLDMQLTSDYTRTIEDAKVEMIQNIEDYDSSDNVNAFLVNNKKAWFTSAQRSNYRNSIAAAELLNIENLSFYIDSLLITLPTNIAKNMLAQIQLYADQCYIVTQQHKNIVNDLENIEKIDNYNYATGYPKMLEFIIN